MFVLEGTNRVWCAYKGDQSNRRKAAYIGMEP